MSPFPAMFSTHAWKPIILATFVILSFVIGLNLDKSKSLPYGKELKGNTSQFLGMYVNL